MRGCGRVCIVDDDPDFACLLKAVLTRIGYECEIASDGRELLPRAAATPPELFLLDMMMPSIPGNELCRLIKQEPALNDVPVIIITGMNRDAGIREAFSAGAVDYISKPVNTREVEMRVGTHIRLHRLNREMGRRADHMQRLAEERLQQLIHADRLAVMGTLLASATHQLCHPLTSLVGNVRFLEEVWPVVAGTLSGAEAAVRDGRVLAVALDEMPKVIDAFVSDMRRMEGILSDLRGFARKETVHREVTDIGALTAAAVSFCRTLVGNGVDLTVEPAPGPLPVECMPQHVEQVIVNLVTNARDAVAGREGGRVTVATSAEAGRAHVYVTDNGPGIPVDCVSRIWEPFFTTKGPQKGTGLGLFVAQSIVKNHGGSISVGAGPGGGARFDIDLPLAQRKDG